MVTAKRKLMTKQELLKKLHAMVWSGDDYMDQQVLCDIQDLIDREIIAEARVGTMKVKQLNNGYISAIDVV